MASTLVILVLSIVALRHYHIGITMAQLDIGVNYGMVGDNLPSPATVVQLYKRYIIGKMRLYDPNPDVLNALRGSGIDVTLGIKNQDLPSIASSADAAKTWFDTNVQPYVSDINFQYITAGNEVVPGDLAQYVLLAMQNLQTTISNYKYTGLRVSTVVASSTLGSSYPPSSGVFTDIARADMIGIINFLSSTSSPLLVNAYPYFAYASDPTNVRLDYAQFTAPGPVVQDGNLSYSNLLDAIVDAFYWAMEKEGVSSVDVVVSESGWPSAGNGDFTTPQLAQTYNQNFVKKFLAKQATPKRPDHYLEGFIFAMFNEDQKPQGVEQNWGLFYPDGTPVYPVFS
ncbi:probable glucan endo-1,3-beta-glucosidase BG4 [Syzygium oleosum]|uniref:probable glucan endo-1,3-beta-glucosidase BG4 n=1 Tax=Syzygium oleosum TaxID=219896 RepID=UPI0011D1ED30|nr:probable glucan endo-1,3-beta-glucosidase BG4 [Syzygium oleosum]